MDQRHSLGDLQLAIMRVLWDAGEASASEVHRALHRARALAPTTIATMLRKMEDKGVVTHRIDGRVFVYRATVAEADVHSSMVGQLIERLFEGDAKALVNHLVSAGDIDLDELDSLRRQLEAAERAEEDDA